MTSGKPLAALIVLVVGLSIPARGQEITEFQATAQQNTVQGIASGSDGNLWFTAGD